MRQVRPGGEKTPARHLQPLWREAVGETIARSCRPVSLEGRTLVIAAATDQWARELERKAPEIVARLRGAYEAWNKGNIAPLFQNPNPKKNK